jgi:hypothetical protein
MTAGEIADHKEKVKKIMVDHLTSLGYPDLTNDQIMGQLKAMWVKIEEAGLVTDGMNFQAFQAHANNAYMMEHVKDIMGI